KAPTRTHRSRSTTRTQSSRKRGTRCSTPSSRTWKPTSSRRADRPRRAAARHDDAFRSARQSPVAAWFGRLPPETTDASGDGLGDDDGAVDDVGDAGRGPRGVFGCVACGPRADLAVEVDRAAVVADVDQRVVDDRAALERLVDAIGDVAGDRRAGER